MKVPVTGSAAFYAACTMRAECQVPSVSIIELYTSDILTHFSLVQLHQKCVNGGQDCATRVHKNLHISGLKDNMYKKGNRYRNI